MSGSFSGVWGSVANDVWLTGDNTLRHFDGATWSSVDSVTTPLTSVWGIDTSPVWVVGYDGLNGTILHHP